MLLCTTNSSPFGIIPKSGIVHEIISEAQMNGEMTRYVSKTVQVRITVDGRDGSI